TQCIVIPDGLESECLILFDFALNAARDIPDIRFCLRMHPVLPFAKLARHHPHLKALPRNVYVSDRADIAADFADSAWALYRGSSAIVHGVLMGVRPMYLERPNELSIDPLFAMKGWRQRVDNVAAFRVLLSKDRAAAAPGRQAEWEAARDFCDRYVVSP